MAASLEPGRYRICEPLVFERRVGQPSNVNLASFFNIAGPDVLILAFVLIFLIGGLAVIVFSIVALVSSRSRQKPPPLPPTSPPPPPRES
jgi:hypothetical protein